MTFDILFVADPRFKGGTSSSVAAEIKAAARAGLRCALLMVKGPTIRKTRPVTAELAALVDAGLIGVVDPADAVAAGVVLIHHPAIFTHLPTRRLAVAAGTVVLVLQHPERDAAGAVQYDLPAIVNNIVVSFGVDVVLAPVGPLCRATLTRPAPPHASVLAEDWLGVIDLADWPQRPPGPPRDPPIIGRHSRPELEKWPLQRETALAAYPADGSTDVRLLGADPQLLEARYGPLPPAWFCLPFGSTPVAAFLAGLDFYIYFHAETWVEAFGRAIVEALAVGLVVILPPEFAPLFGTAAVYARPEDVAAVIAGFRADPDAYARQCEMARAAAREMFGEAGLISRLARLCGGPPAPPAAPHVARRPDRERVVMITSNGVGLGHLTRQLAIARHLPQRLQPVIVTMSQAVELARDAGHLVEHIPFHRALGAPPESWNAVLAEDIHAMLAFYRPRVAVFDGNVPYAGLCDALRQFPEIFSVWVRRAMWSPVNAGALDAAAAFDAVIEPGEAAAAYDPGETRSQAADVLAVPPILFVEPDERFGRAAARTALGAGEGRVVVAVQLGASNNYDMGEIRAALLAALLARPEVDVVEFASPIARAVPASAGPRHVVRQTYPTFPLSAGFDFAVSAAGYNSFHEALAGRVPTIFVPNEAEEMDLQIVRASFADRAGFGRLLRTRDVFAAAGALAQMMDPACRAAMATAAARHAAGTGGGAAAAARFIATLAQFVRADRDTMAGTL